MYGHIVRKKQQLESFEYAVITEPAKCTGFTSLYESQNFKVKIMLGFLTLSHQEMGTWTVWLFLCFFNVEFHALR